MNIQYLNQIACFGRAFATGKEKKWDYGIVATSLTTTKFVDEESIIGRGNDLPVIQVSYFKHQMSAFYAGMKSNDQWLHLSFSISGFHTSFIYCGTIRF